MRHSTLQQNVTLTMPTRHRNHRIVLTSNTFSALELVGLLVVTQSIDEEAQVLHVFDAVGNHHVLVNKVRLGQVGSGLQREKATTELSRHTLSEW